MKLGVVIVTYNRIELLKECLQCVMCQDLPFERVIVVDNNSSDGTSEFLDEVKRTWHTNKNVCDINVLHQKKNLGGAGGFFFALSEARKYKFDYVLIIDDDAMISNDYMSKIVACAEAHPEYVAFAGRVESDGKIDTNHRRVIGSKLILSENSVPAERYNLDDRDYTFKCDCATFCGLVIRGSVLINHGLPKKEYFIFYDDTEYCMRLRQDGGVLVLPSALLTHKSKPQVTSGSILMRTDWKNYYGYRNRYDCARVHFGRITAFVILIEYRTLLFTSRMMCKSKNLKIRQKGEFNVEMISDVLKDISSNVLGYNNKYHG